MTGLPDFAAFARCVGDSFELDHDGAPVNAELIEASPLGDAADRPFSLLFRVVEGPPLEQQIYALEHDRLGRFELFLVPIGADRSGERSGQRYEAIFT